MGGHLGLDSHSPEAALDLDADLLALESQFVALLAELDGHIGNFDTSNDFVTMEDEAVLARLDPIERAIMESPAQTITGLGVKARHLAYALSEYWEAPIDQVTWEGRAVRLLTEAICQMANVPLRIRDQRSKDSAATILAPRSDPELEAACSLTGPV